jgi:hypothetical protein
MIVVLALTGPGFYYGAAEETASFLRWSQPGCRFAVSSLVGAAYRPWLALHIARGRRMTRHADHSVD